MVESGLRIVDDSVAVLGGVPQEAFVGRHTVVSQH